MNSHVAKLKKLNSPLSRVNNPQDVHLLSSQWLHQWLQRLQGVDNVDKKHRNQPF